jgi:phage shock protein PspC (stress-responsive transcriptional regulator)
MTALVRADDRWVAGVCSGLARRFGITANQMRLIFVISCLLPGPQFVVYLVLWVLMPDERKVGYAGR